MAGSQNMNGTNKFPFVELEKSELLEGNIMDKKVLKKILFVLSIVFTILTFVGVAYVLFNKGQVSAGYSAVPMLWAVLFTTTYSKVKKDLERE